MVRHVHPRLENYVAELSPDDLPPLPKLTGPLSKEVRAHRSYRGMQLDGFEEAEGSKAMDYERQELNGDWELSFITTLYVDELYPRLAVGQRTFIHDAIVTNRVLRVLSHTYGLEKRLLAAESEGLALSRNASIQADLFEAYLGGVQQQLGEAVAAAWIRGIIGPMIHLAYKDRKKASAKMEESKRELKQEKKANRPTRIKSGTVTPVGTPIEDMDEIVYPRNSLSAAQIFARAQDKAVTYSRSDFNAGAVYLDEVKMAELEGEPGENWKSVKSKLADKLLAHFNVE